MCECTLVCIYITYVRSMYYVCSVYVCMCIMYVRSMYYVCSVDVWVYVCVCIEGANADRPKYGGGEEKKVIFYHLCWVIVVKLRMAQILKMPPWNAPWCVCMYVCIYVQVICSRVHTTHRNLVTKTAALWLASWTMQGDLLLFYQFWLQSQKSVPSLSLDLVMSHKQPREYLCVSEWLILVWGSGDQNECKADSCCANVMRVWWLSEQLSRSLSHKHIVQWFIWWPYLGVNFLVYVGEWRPKWMCGRFMLC